MSPAPASRVGTPECVSISSMRLTREQVVDRIITLNPSASPEFLDRFPEPALDEYLRRLDSAQEPRGRRATWVRRGSSPAIVGHHRRV